MSTTTNAPKRIGRRGTGWEVACAALFLISNESSYVNAHALFLDGGHMAGIVRS
jgi:NAD(P)-dependent dehydrogenase (short-subunit alcohol dehydrogenase family)